MQFTCSCPGRDLVSFISNPSLLVTHQHCPLNISDMYENRVNGIYIGIVISLFIGIYREI